MIECVSRYLLSAYKDIVAACSTGIDTQLLQGMLDHKHVAIEGEIDICGRSDIGEHDVALVGIDTSASALAAVHPDSIPAAVGHVNLAVDKLVAPEDDRRLYLPHEKIVLRG